MNKVQSVAFRFVKGFVAGGLAQLTVFLGSSANGINVSNTTQLKQLGLGIFTSFLIGGILATEKALTWTEQPTE